MPWNKRWQFSVKESTLVFLSSLLMIFPPCWLADQFLAWSVNSSCTSRAWSHLCFTPLPSISLFALVILFLPGLMILVQWISQQKFRCWLSRREEDFWCASTAVPTERWWFWWGFPSADEMPVVTGNAEVPLAVSVVPSVEESWKSTVQQNTWQNLGNICAFKCC